MLFWSIICYVISYTSLYAFNTQNSTKTHLYHLFRCCRHGPLTRYLQLRVAHAPGMLGKFTRHRLKRKPLVSYPDMHHGTYVTAIWQEAHASCQIAAAQLPWCIPGSLTRGGGENVPDILGAWATSNFTHREWGPWATYCNKPALWRDGNLIYWHNYNCLTLLTRAKYHKFMSTDWYRPLISIFCPPILIE